MAVEIRRLEPCKKELLKFIHFPTDVLYKGNAYYVPDLVSDMLTTFLPEENPAYEFCESAFFMAYRDGKPVGRIAAIINSLVNKREGVAEGRFGFVDFIDDDEVVDALMDAAVAWAKERGMTKITGPLGFTDMDPEGCLIEGFDQLSTQATIYNYPYYQKQFERLGFVKDVDWVEFKVFVPEAIPEKMVKIGNIVQHRFGLHLVHMNSTKELVKKYGDAIFSLINEAYDSLFGYSPLSQKQMQHYIDVYLPFLPLDHISLVADADENLVGVGISVPSLSKALIKSRGRMLPFGWWHMLKAIKKEKEIVDLLLIAVKPEYQSKGVNSLFFLDLLPAYFKRGYKWAETNIELESNENVQKQWQYFDLEQHKRRRAFTKSI
ncbi:MAG: N-acetyltransferase [Bacteroidales bacterium]|nr:N-acetyltransferase [Bacteroidales bacterium]